MKQATLYFFILSLFILCPLNEAYSDKIVIGSHPSGLFSNFIRCLHMLGWCDKNNVEPVVYWVKNFLYLQEGGYNGSLNGWEYYFEPVSNQAYKKGDKIYARYCSPGGRCIKQRDMNSKGIQKFRHWAHALIKKYIKVNSIVQEKIDAFEKSHFTNKKVVGIHLRGTDKKQDVKPVNPQRLFDAANKFKDCIYFVATDEQRLLDLAISKLHGPVIYYDAHRSLDGKPMHGNNKYPSGKIGEDVLIEALLLAKCDHFIHTSSCVAFAVLFFNPSLPNIMLSAPKN